MSIFLGLAEFDAQVVSDRATEVVKEIEAIRKAAKEEWIEKKTKEIKFRFWQLLTPIPMRPYTREEAEVLYKKSSMADGFSAALEIELRHSSLQNKLNIIDANARTVLSIYDNHKGTRGRTYGVDCQERNMSLLKEKYYEQTY
jgi:hypothetical protein